MSIRRIRVSFPSAAAPESPTHLLREERRDGPSEVPRAGEHQHSDQPHEEVDSERCAPLGKLRLRDKRRGEEAREEVGWGH